MRPSIEFPRAVRRVALALVLALGASQSGEASVRQIREMNPAGFASDPNIVAKSGGRLFFLAYDGSGGQYLWSTDGTVAGTVRLTQFAFPQLTNFVFLDLDGTLFFANKLNGMLELWKSDGTAAGTERVTALPQELGNNIQAAHFVNLSGTLFFASWTNGGWYDLWKSDGTEAGTVRVADVAIDVYYSNMVAGGGLVYFASSDAAGEELWRSDGTEAGTWRVKDINPGADSSSPQGLAMFGNVAYFAATDPVNGFELWKSDGTEAGTTRVTDIAAGTASSNPRELTVMNGALYFLANSAPSTVGIWKTDGTTTTFVATAGDIYGTAGNLLFYSNPGPYNLSATDGSPGGARPIGATNAYVRDIQAIGGQYYYTINDYELWRTDGTVEGTAKMSDAIWLAFGEFKRHNLYVLGDALFFQAADKVTREGELWTSDGTTEGTEIFYDIAPAPAASVNLSSLTPNGDQLAFVNTPVNSDPPELWLSNGSAAGTWRATSTVVPRTLAAWNGTVVVEGYEGGSDGLWTWQTSDGLEKIHSGASADMVGIGDRLFFNEFSTAYLSHGDAVTEIALKTIPGPVGCVFFHCVEFPSNPRGFTDLGNVVIFGATAANGPELWRTDGTTEGTVKIADVGPIIFDGPLDGAAVGGKFYFVTADDAGEELWVSDGTEAGTLRLADINPGAEGSSPTDFTPMNGKMYFTATDGASGRELWTSDGTPEGTALVSDIEPGAAGSDPSDLVVFDDALFFAATKSGGGRELWKYDGASAPTRFMDINPGEGGSNPGDFEIGGHAMYFRADDGAAGAELWVTDGTPQRTVLFADVDPGPDGASPSELTRAGRNLFFYAYNAEHGRELWATDIPVDCGNSITDPYETCDDGNVVPGDGCDESCTVETCGDGNRNPGEQCDDGNRDDGDGCTRGCIVDCLPAPEAGCIQTIEPEAASLLMKGSLNPSKSKLSWRWQQGDAATAEEVGDPLTDTSYEVCVYDATGLVLGTNAPAGDLWTGADASYRYKRSKDRGQLKIGMRSATTAGESAINVKMKGGELSLPDLRPIAQPLVVQVRNGSACWDATYSTQFDSQTETLLKATSD